MRRPDDGLHLECADREVAPEWVRAYVPAEWVERYGERLEHERLPKEEEERKQYANQVGVDGWALLQATSCFQYSRLDENSACRRDPAHQSSSSNLNHKNKEDNGEESLLGPQPNRLTPPMTSMLATARKGPRYGWVTCVHFSETRRGKMHRN